MKESSTTWVLDENNHLVPVKEKNEGSKYGFLFFTICLLILGAGIGQYIIYTGDFFSEQMGQIAAITMWILVAAGVLMSVLLMVYVRNKRMLYAEDYGFNPDTEKIKDFNIKFSKTLGEERKAFNEKFGVNLSFDDYLTHRYTGWKKLKKLEKKNLLPEGLEILDVDNDGDIEIVKKDEEGNYVQFSFVDPDDDGNYEFVEWDPDELSFTKTKEGPKIKETESKTKIEAEVPKPKAEPIEKPKVIKEELSDEELFKQFLEYKKKEKGGNNSL